MHRANFTIKLKFDKHTSFITGELKWELCFSQSSQGSVFFIYLQPSSVVPNRSLKQHEDSQPGNITQQLTTSLAILLQMLCGSPVMTFQ